MAESQELWEALIMPPFLAHQIVYQELVGLRPSHIQGINQGLHFMEVNGTRNTKRAGVYVADDQYALLVTDMTRCKNPITSICNMLIIPAPRENEIVVEIKPKWLCQSPNAPDDAVRCRQCAITARRNFHRALEDPDAPMLKAFCPLDITSENVSDVYEVIKTILPPNTSYEKEAHLLSWLLDDELLTRLRNLQKYLDHEGPLGSLTNSFEFRIAMTLRDCTLFVRMDDYRVIEARLGDLDVKCSSKRDYWRQTETELISEGWYDGTDPLTTQWELPITCRLGRLPTRD